MTAQPARPHGVVAASAPGANQDRHTARVGVFGATGYTGQLLLRLLATHPHVRMAFATSESASETLDGQALVPQAEAPLELADAVFLCLPNGVSGGVAARALNAGLRVVDLSADLRLDSAAMYEKWYKVAHPAPHLLPVPYGLPEIARQALIGAAAVANPGCHVTAALLALAPLAKSGALTADPIIVDSKTGISGAGKALKPESMFCEVYGDVKPYHVGHVHRHVPEIEQALYKLQTDAGPLVFAPHLVPLEVGLLATVYVRLKAGWDLARAREAFTAAYGAEPLVRLLAPERAARIRDVAHQNHAVVALHDGPGDCLVVTCALDNLRKGAASQALQNFNLMMGFPETAGLL